MNYPYDLGEILRKRRLAVGLSQEELAEKCGLHRTYIGPVELGKKNITIATAWKLAKALHIPLSEIFRTMESNYDNGD